MTWILLRGLTREARHWATFPAGLERALPGERVVAVDLPGAGVLHRERSPADIEGFVDACRREAARLEAQPPFAFVALSLGAMVAVAWAHRYPDEVRRCVLLNTSLRPFAPFYRRLRPTRYATVLRAMFASGTRAREDLVLKMTSGRASARAGVIDLWSDIARERPVTRANALRQLWAAACYRAPASPPRCNVLLLASRADRLVDVRCSRAIARAWQVPLVEHPWAGHDLALDDPQWVVEQVRAWAGSPAPPPDALCPQ